MTTWYNRANLRLRRRGREFWAKKAGDDLNLAILQARMTSTRAPGKVMEPILGEPMIGRQIERLRRCRRIDRLVVATSAEASDDVLVRWCEAAGVTVYRGALDDVLARFAGAAAAFPQAQAVVRLTADCPLTDSQLIDQVIDHHLASGADYTNNTAPIRTYPHGLDVEVMRPQVLVEAQAKATSPHEREHVTPFIYGHPELFRLEGVSRSPSLAHLRWTVDYPRDLDFVREVYGALYSDDPAFDSAAIVALPRNSSEIA
jgi:spore coat polysaccharide biosynthesis protein SpsF